MHAPRLRPVARQALLVPLVAFAVMLGGSFALFSGCGLQTSGIPSNVDAGACVSASQCDDNEPCTTDTCSSAGECEHTPLADGPAPAAEQHKGDCKQVVCKGGVATTVADTSDAPTAPDMCTVESCNGETPVHKAAMDGTPCDLTGASGTCQKGVCKVACKMSSDCPSMGPCQTAACDGVTGTCQYTDVTDGTPTPGVNQVSGDCRTHICLMGQDTNAEDDSDIPTLPAAMAGCADAVCDKGAPSFPLHATDSSCSTWMGSQPGFCNASGNCVQCTQDSECVGTGPTTDCQHPACNGGNCAQAFTAAGTATTSNPSQVPGDCQQIDCDGNGGTTTVPDASDTPNDPTGCNPWTCSGTTPTQMQAPDGTTCGSSGLSCKAGVCQGCTMDSQCQSGGKTNGKCVKPNCTCTPSTCAQLGLTCGSAPDGCGGTLNCNNGKDGMETGPDCGGPAQHCQARCIAGQGCSASSDCQSGLFCVDGVCCNSQCTTGCNACTAALKGQGADGVCGAVVAGGSDPLGTCTKAAQSTCGETGVCNGSGACALYASGTSCVTASCAGNTLTKGATCNGTGTCNIPSPPTVTCAPYMCVGSACTTSCSSDTDCTGGNYCNSSGKCVPKQSNGTSCTAADQCTSGHCAGAAQGGVCCTSDCTGKCQGCTSALTGGTNGTCANVKTSTADPSGTCTDQGAASCGTDGKCTSTAACETYPSGTVCSTASCSGGMMTAAGTCNTMGMCSAGMKSSCGQYQCNSGGTACLTSCSSDGDCIGADFCNGSNQCQAKAGNGGTCTAGAGDQCTSGICGPNGVCCATTCSDQGAASCGTDGNCLAGAGMGACEKYPAGTTGCTGATTCSGGVLTTKNQCDGNGGCTQGGAMMTCSGNTKCMNGTSCIASCANTSQCQTGFCTTGGTCASNNDGAGCQGNADCSSGACLGGICCTSGCATGTCGVQSCTAGTGACVYAGAYTACGAPSGFHCSGSTQNGNICDGLGNCQGLSITCSNGCSGTDSCTACANDGECSTWGFCLAGICTPKGQTGGTCLNGNACLSGTCTFGHCT